MSPFLRHESFVLWEPLAGRECVSAIRTSGLECHCLLWLSLSTVLRWCYPWLELRDPSTLGRRQRSDISPPSDRFQRFTFNVATSFASDLIYEFRAVEGKLSSSRDVDE